MASTYNPIVSRIRIRALDKTRGLDGLPPIRPIVSRITSRSLAVVLQRRDWKTLALPNLIALQHIPLSPAGVIAKRPAPKRPSQQLRSLNGEWERPVAATQPYLGLFF